MIGLRTACIVSLTGAGKVYRVSFADCKACVLRSSARPVADPLRDSKFVDAPSAASENSCLKIWQLLCDCLSKVTCRTSHEYFPNIICRTTEDVMMPERKTVYISSSVQSSECIEFLHVQDVLLGLLPIVVTAHCYWQWRTTLVVRLWPWSKNQSTALSLLSICQMRDYNLAETLFVWHED